MSDSKTSIQIGPHGPTLLTILFVLLKVLGYTNWSWWWVFSPLWISAIIVALILLAFVAIALIVILLE